VSKKCLKDIVFLFFNKVKNLGFRAPDSHHDTDVNELPTPISTKKGNEKRFYNKKSFLEQVIKDMGRRFNDTAAHGRVFNI